MQAIRVERARTHNLKDVTCHFPLRRMTVVSGVSGSGKSTLAFDTLYAEGQRRYVSSLSTYARQFLERLPRPDVDAISHLPPAIAIEQRNRVTNARSTVGTATEILDHLRLLFARIGVTRCPDCECEAQPGTVQAVADRIAARFDGQRLAIAAPIQKRKGEKPRELRERLARSGYTRLLAADGSVEDVSEMTLKRLQSLVVEGLLLVDRLRAADDDENRGRLTQAVGEAFDRGGGELVVVAVDDEAARFGYREGLACDQCGRRFPEPEPALFSFNSPLGACEECQGFGRVAGLDFERVVPDPLLSLEGDAIAPFTTKMGRSMKRDMLAACRAAGVPTKQSFQSLDAEQRAFVFEGDEDEGGDWYGVRGFFEWLEGRRYKVQARVLIARYRRFDLCPVCDGARLRRDALSVQVAGTGIGELQRSTVAGLRHWVDHFEASDAERERCAGLLELLRARVATVDEVGLGYLSLDRQVRTLSGGEAQRIQLGTALSGHLTATLYVLDEPSIGLHARDVGRLLRVLRRIRDHGNTLVVVEHAPEIVAAADHVVDLGPAAGKAGGELIVEGPVEVVRAHVESQTGRALRGEWDRSAVDLAARAAKRQKRGALRIRGASEHNLQDIDVEIPLGRLVVMTGVSGAGKSTLVGSVLVGHLRGDPDRGACKGIDGSERVLEVVVVDQSPAVRSPRSNPATVSKAFEHIRKKFAATREAKSLGVGPGWFSFNVAGGRCESCEGTGEVVIDMQFLDDVRVPCEHCGGTRYRREVNEVKIDGRTIVDVLALSVDEAIVAFAREPRVGAALEPLARVGLGYLGLGQPLSTLSGGEHQRLRLAAALGGDARGILYVLDEPTTGLHPADVDVLLACLEALVEAGGSVIVVEHNLEVIRRADHVIDLGPEGGPGGGHVVVAGTPDEIAAAADSYTGAALRGEVEGFPEP